MTDRYAVIGNPISHSKSPLIHKMFAEQTGQDMIYKDVIEAPLDGFAATIQRLRDAGYKGCNVTVPFKFEAWNLVSDLDNRSEIAAEAANTLTFKDDKVIGNNTDGIGLITDITKNWCFEIANKRVLIMGFGGAAHGVSHPLLNEHPSELVIANRKLDKAFSFKNKIEDSGEFPNTSISISEYQKLSNKKFDLVINATSAGLTDSEIPLPENIFAPGALAYDMMYGRETPFMKFAKQQGAQVADGLGMLVEQAAEAFFIWRGVRPDTAPVLAALRATL